jgi:hypothetical protein
MEEGKCKSPDQNPNSIEVLYDEGICPYWTIEGFNTWLTGFVRIVVYSSDDVYEVYEGEIRNGQKNGWGRRIDGI